MEELSREVLEEISAALQRGRVRNVTELVSRALEEKIPAQEVLDNGLIAGMEVVGERFKTGRAFVPEVMLAARAMAAGAELLKPHMVSGEAEAKGTVVIGTVKGDRHDIGKNLVKMMMEGKGLEVIDLGVDVPKERFIETALERKAGIIVCSALLTTSMGQMKEIVEEAEKRGVREQLTIMVGGAPVTQEFCDKIHADIYTEDAASAAEAAVRVYQQ